MTTKTVLIGGAPCSGVEWLGRIFAKTSGVVVNKNTDQASAAARSYAFDPSSSSLRVLAAAQEIARNQIMPTNLYVHADPWNLWSAADLLKSQAIEGLHVVIVSRPCAEVISWQQGDARVQDALASYGQTAGSRRLFGDALPNLRPHASTDPRLSKIDRMVLWWWTHEHELSLLTSEPASVTSKLSVVSYGDLHRDPFGTLWNLRAEIGMQSQFPMIESEERRLPGEDFERMIAEAKARLFLED